MLSITPWLTFASPTGAVIVSLSGFNLRKRLFKRKLERLHLYEFEHLWKNRHFPCTHNLKISSQ